MTGFKVTGSPQMMDDDGLKGSEDFGTQHGWFPKSGGTPNHPNIKA